MLSHKIITRQDVGRCASYYEDSADDYYAKEGDSKVWSGKGAEKLGLSGEVDPAQFRQLLAGETNKDNPASHKSTRLDCKRRLAIDLTFSAPKSVSLQALIGGDKAVVAAHDIAVQRAIDNAESYAQARKKLNNKSMVETTGNLIVAKFRHETSRERDPHLHTHAVVLNLTQRQDGEWRALKNDEIIKTTKFLGAVYRSELAKELQRLGYELRHDREGMFELAHISRDQLSAFSQRSQQIETALAEKGLTRENATSDQIQQITLESRKSKTALDRENLYNEWVARSKELDVNFKKDLKVNNTNHEKQELALVEELAAKRSVKYAVNHLTERQSVITRSSLLDTAIKHGIGRVSLKGVTEEIERQTDKGFLIKSDPLYYIVGDIKSEAKTKNDWVNYLVKDKKMNKTAAKIRFNKAVRQGALVEKEARYTTQTALERERVILKIERDGREKLEAILESNEVQERLKNSSLNDSQKESVNLILSSKNRIVGVQGVAGSGKSHMLGEAEEILKSNGYKLQALAPYGSQVKSLRNDGLNAKTLASFLKSKDKNINEKTVIVVDEAGIVPTRLMEQTLKLAEKNNSKVILIGDTKQTKAIEAGKPFAQLQNSGMLTAKMNEIRRQNNQELKKAVEYASEKNTGKSLEHISHIKQIKNEQKRYKSIANDYVKLDSQDRDKTLIVAGTNKARREINEMVRDGLGVKGNGLTFDCLVRRDTTQEERLYSKNYRIGDVIQPEKDYEKIGLERGKLYKIVDNGVGNHLTVKPLDDNNELSNENNHDQVKFSPYTYRKISVYESIKAELSAGDYVRITRNDAEKDIANGDRMKVLAVSDEKVVLDDNGKRKLSFETNKPLHMDHAYATTVHSSQGLTSEKVLIEANTRSKTITNDVYYVAISRAKEEARIYTNDKSHLPESIKRDNLKHSALDVAKSWHQTEHGKSTQESSHSLGSKETQLTERTIER